MNHGGEGRGAGVVAASTQTNQWEAEWFPTRSMGAWFWMGWGRKGEMKWRAVWGCEKERWESREVATYRCSLPLFAKCARHIRNLKGMASMTNLCNL